MMVKECGIGDASRGSLSSYAYVLMMIHFLQRVNVLPVLQELYDGETQPVNTVEGFNTWFQEDSSFIKARFNSPNKDPLSKLWIEFLDYFVNFEFDKETIQIRFSSSLTTFEKEWTSKCISIEDPFELTHNLGNGVSRKMANYIVKVFQRARKRFEYFFCRWNLTMYA